MWPPNLGDSGDDLPGHAQALGGLVSRDVLGYDAKERGQRPGLQRALGLGSYKTAWTWLHKLRRAMVRPGRDRLTGRVEVDETQVSDVVLKYDAYVDQLFVNQVGQRFYNERAIRESSSDAKYPAGADGTRVNFFLVAAPDAAKVLIELYEPAPRLD